ncbi:glutathione S-transferase family protein [Cognatishimia sp. F0-27]|uniref:glutathione S-transferase family protein n=1 Tax=Cognatishimia sp. F0-27 TaxID=2816855 RepID=UPI001D0C7E0F|nr:glutathione S-transferase family protein [Cognatishimia sp. F0-27]MCC1494324.1 glutathione S-transferase family protein [Cognatishimia sp. F0-27]
MPDLTLFVAPNTCARVPTIALEEIGVPFETELIRVKINQQKSPEFLKINPKGKVPTLLIDGEPLTENVAILSWLAATYPEAHLLPETEDPLERVRQTADLAFFAGTVHPLVTRVAMPLKFIPDAAQSFEIVRPMGIEDMKKVMQMIEARLENGPWWYGETWSVVDGYLFWVWGRITGVGFPADEFPNIRAHHAAMQARPAVQRAMAREARNIETLKAEDLYVAPR